MGNCCKKNLPYKLKHLWLISQEEENFLGALPYPVAPTLLFLLLALKFCTLVVENANISLQATWLQSSQDMEIKKPIRHNKDKLTNYKRVMVQMQY